MKLLRWIVPAGVLLLLATVAALGPIRDPEGRRWLEHVRYLASDAMRGRQTGSPEHLRAAEYVAAQFKALGLAPGVNGSYLQPVSFLSRRVREDGCRLDLVFPDRVDALVLGQDATLQMSCQPADSIEAPLVFIGYGISVPEHGFDELAGADLEGKIVVYLQGGPAAVPEPRRSQAQFSGERWARLREAGAVGLIAIRNPHSSESTWERAATQRFNPSMGLADADVDERQGQRFGASFNPERAQKLFAGSGHFMTELLALADSGAALPVFPLVPRLRAKVAYEQQAVESQNVVAVLPGRDPALRDEYVVLTAHLDHLGVGVPVAGDSIFNGAMDNASGVASLIEVARALVPANRRPARSLLFVCVTGEEKGLLGSYYFSRRPTVPMASVIADINVDMVLPIIPLEHLIVFGQGESDLGDLASAEAGKVGIEVVPDAEPERNRFIRSDQFNFIRAGVPSIALSVAGVPGSPEDSLLRAWTHTRYHQPSDDLAQPMDPKAAGDLIRYVSRLSAAVADAPARPRWKDTSFFRRYAAGAP
ncbi:MAG: M28 family metallopeptidase [Candidatus Eisenbacteria bacterium]